jgi:hypothetical protein
MLESNSNITKVPSVLAVSDNGAGGFGRTFPVSSSIGPVFTRNTFPYGRPPTFTGVPGRKHQAILRVTVPINLSHHKKGQRGKQNDSQRNEAGKPLLCGIGIKRTHALLAFAALRLRSREHVEKLALRGVIFFQRVQDFLSHFLAEIFVAVELVGVLGKHGLQ